MYRARLDQAQTWVGRSGHRSHVGAVERGEVNISIDNVYRLAVALDVATADLLTKPCLLLCPSTDPLERFLSRAAGTYSRAYSLKWRTLEW